jgi:hypothetical protein
MIFVSFFVKKYSARLRLKQVGLDAGSGSAYMRIREPAYY